MSNEVAESNADMDLGSGGEMLLPDMTDSSNTVRHLVVGAGKDGNIYVVDRDAMGKFNAASNNNYQTLNGALPGGIWSTPAYFNGTVYYGDVCGTLKAFAIIERQTGRHAAVADPPRNSSIRAPRPACPRTAPPTASYGPMRTPSTAVLHAYDATNLAHELYNSNQAAGESRPVRHRQQVHHAGHRGWQSFRRHDQRRGGVRTAALAP